jgi:hypothetical protein
VVSREVSLLPRHWEWLEQQPNGISAALRRIVGEASTRNPDAQRARRARDAASRVMTALAATASGFQEASRAVRRDRPLSRSPPLADRSAPSPGPTPRHAVAVTRPR